MLSNLEKYKIVLGSASPRRKELLTGLDLDFEVRVMEGIKESYPKDLRPDLIPVFIAAKKAKAYKKIMPEDELLITADTIVWTYKEVLGKPADRDAAIEMLKQLSGNEHQVITGVCLTSKQKSLSFSQTSSVTFGELTDEEIEYYVDKYQPFDKAGAYGVQEWIGYIGVESVKGSFYNVMGLPVRRLYQELKNF
ncbi:MAG: Maf family nucleotide pyrophosphatase [Parabacteroides sp.]|nr:Maf family nucleotide pyrophosphatase [Parabacteroides sp.]